MQEGTDYTVSKWPDLQGREHDNFECTKCAYATLDKDRMAKHLTTAGGRNGHGHAWAKEGPPIQSTRVPDTAKEE